MYRSALVALFLIIGLTTATAAEQARVLSWDDLVPASPPIADPLENVSINVRYDLGFIARVRADLAQGFITEDSEEYRNAMKLKREHAANGIDTDALMKAIEDIDAEIARRGTEVVRDLEGTLVRLPGYALPFEQSDSGVSELLLVPYVGACIHVPPPPANQMVYVKLRKSHVIESLYDPVWVTGRLTAEPASRSLSYVDGQAPIATGYTLTGINIEPYE